MKRQTSEWVEIDGITVHVTRKNVRGLRMRVTGADNHVELSVPYRESLSRALEFVRSKRDWICKQQVYRDASVMAQAENASADEVAQWKAVVAATVPVLVEAWEPIMGVKAGKLAYRNMKSRWGSCQPDTGRICINTRLALYPPECLEYVVVHELCHLIERGHGPRFYALMDTYLPDWKQRRARLR